MIYNKSKSKVYVLWNFQWSRWTSKNREIIILYWTKGRGVHEDAGVNCYTQKSTDII